MELCTLVIAQSFSTGLLRKQMTKTRILVIRKMITTSPPQETSLNILFQTFSFGVLQAREIGTDCFLCASISIRNVKLPTTMTMMVVTDCHLPIIFLYCHLDIETIELKMTDR